jgi:hypothetical protein
MPPLVLKLVLTPLLVGGSALVARRWGPSVGGWLIALPLTSGPVLVFVALDHGLEFAASAATGSLGGLAAIAVYCIGYAWAAGSSVRRSLTVATVAFAATSLALLPLLPGPVLLLAGVVAGSIVAATRFVPASGLSHPPVAYPRWDLPARMVVATALVVGITTYAPLLGPQWSGLLATFGLPVRARGVHHRHAGAVAATDVLRGLLAGLFRTTAFYLVIPSRWRRTDWQSRSLRRSRCSRDRGGGPLDGSAHGGPGPA